MPEQEVKTETVQQEEPSSIVEQEVKTSQEDGKSKWDLTEQFRSELSASNRREGALKIRLDQALESLQKVDVKSDSSDQETDLDDYDVLVKTVKDLKDQVSHSKDESEILKGQLNSITQQSRNELGKRLLNDEITSLEKEFGKTNTNTVLEQVESEYDEYEVSTMADKPRAAWVKKNLRLAYIELERKKNTSVRGTGKRNSTSTATVDTGQGGSDPSTEIPEGTFAEVSKAMLERDRRLGW